jgi:hypothetical protein
VARVFLCVMGISLLSVSVQRSSGEVRPIIFEAESFAKLDAPMQVVAVGEGASGGSYVELPLGAGQGWRGLGSGGVEYAVQVGEAGPHYVWARTLWKDSCTNAFFAQVNGQKRFVFGNDAVFNLWHWVRSPAQQFHEGRNHITLTNHSDGTAIDKLIVTSASTFVPEGLGEGITHFYDGFGGCDGANFGSWDLQRGQWRVIGGTQDSNAGANDCLVQWSPEGGAALTGYADWKDYSVRVQMMSLQGAEAGLVVCDQADGQLRLALLSQGAEPALELQQVVKGRTTVLARRNLPQVSLDQWHELFVQVRGRVVTASLDGGAALTADLIAPAAGRVGLSAAGAGVMFDNVEVVFDGA